MRVPRIRMCLLGCFAFSRVVGSSIANHECRSRDCQDNGDDGLSLIQSLVEPDLMRNVQVSSEDHKKLSAGALADETAALVAGTIAGKTTTVKPEVQGTKVKANMAGDLPAFGAAIMSCSFMFVFMILTFMFLQRHYPKMYAYRVKENWKGGVCKEGGPGREDKPFDFKPDSEITPSWWKWAELSLKMSNEELEQISGLDAAMLIKFTNLSIELMLTFGVPLCILGCPIYAFCGGGFAKDDRLSWAGISNIVWNNTLVTGQPMKKADEAKLMNGQWIFWVVAACVWAVVLWTQHRLFGLQREFIDRRKEWLLNMGQPRCSTVLVQGIPKEYRTDDALRGFFEKMFPAAKVVNAFVMKNVSSVKLPQLWRDKDDYEQKISEKKFAIEHGANTAERQRAMSETQDALQNTISKIKAAQSEIAAEASKPEGQAKGLYMHNGFVTFAHRSDAERALALRMSPDDDEWIFETPPDPSDVRYHDFELSEARAEAYQKLGYAAVAGLFFCFMPLVVGISNVSLAIEHSPRLKGVIKATGMMSTVDGVLATIGLTVMMAMLPTFLMLIFQFFYTLKADRWAQLRLQEYYFWFLVLFVLLVTAVGTNLVETVDKFAHSPFSVFSVLAHSMPTTTHFYLKYVVLQPVTHGMNLTRYFYLMKFMAFTKIVDVNRARELSEPEDQDYYGMGSRSSRFTLMLLIGLVFGTICPLMHIFVLCNFLACRLIYGYLLAFAESKKIDLGGEHWCKQMNHTHQGLLIYLIMMTGILAQRAESKGPGMIAAVSFVWWYIAYRKFTRALHWESLPYEKVRRSEDEVRPNTRKHLDAGIVYCQLELLEPTSDFLS